MYNFGGCGDGDYYSKKVSRIALSLTSDWEALDDMVTAGEDMVVIPYNVWKTFQEFVVKHNVHMY